MTRRGTGVGDVEEAGECAIVMRQSLVLLIRQNELARIVEFVWFETDECIGKRWGPGAEF